MAMYSNVFHQQHIVVVVESVYIIRHGQLLININNNKTAIIQLRAFSVNTEKRDVQ